MRFAPNDRQERSRGSEQPAKSCQGPLTAQYKILEAFTQSEEATRPDEGVWQHTACRLVTELAQVPFAWFSPVLHDNPARAASKRGPKT